MAMKKRVSAFDMEEEDYAQLEKAAKRMGNISIPLYVKIKSLAAAREENLSESKTQTGGQIEKA